MSKPAAVADRYLHQRPTVIPPHVSLGALRRATGRTLDEIIGRIADEFADEFSDEVKPPTRGALSAIENGHRGASARMLRWLESAYGLDAGDLTTTYVPRARETKAVA